MSGPQSGESDADRRAFASRTPVNSNPDQVAYRRGFVTRHQVSGWRFVMRRIASGVALHDTRMLVDPLRSQSRSVLMGVILLVTGIAGCFVLSLIRPGGTVGNDTVLADRATSALYVRLGDELHPVLNLTSARLIAGHPVNPTAVKSTALDKFPRGNMVGIPGAPERMVQSGVRDADWTVCDAVSGTAAGVSVIAGPPQTGGARAGALATDDAVLVDSGAATWLVWNGHRSRIDLKDRAVTGALGIDADLVRPRSIASGLFNAIPEAPPLTMPAIPDVGIPTKLQIPASAVAGAVLVANSVDANAADTRQYYAVLPDGLQPISPVLAAVLRNTDSYGMDEPPSLGADQIAKLPVSRMLDTTRFPDRPVTLVDAVADPVLCAHWSQADGASTSALTLLTGSVLPVADQVRTVDLVAAGSDGTATRVAVPPGSGYFAQTVGQGPAFQPAGSLFWISDTGVRYGIDDPKAVEALGLNKPGVPIPWSVLTLFAPGPALSRDDALVARDWVSPGNGPAQRIPTGEATR